MSIPDENTNIYSEICLANICKFVEMLMEIKYKEGFLSWYNNTNHFIEEHVHVILLTVNLVVILLHFSRSRYHKLQCHQLTEDLRVERKCLREKTAAIDRKLIENREMKERLVSFQEQHDSQIAMKEKIQQLDEKIKILSDLSTTWQQSHVGVLQRRIADMEQKNKDIESIIIDWLYNEPKYLAYKGDEWTFTALASKADELGIPPLIWGSKETLSYILHTVEQLIKICDIIELVYPGGCEKECPSSQEKVGEESEDKEDSEEDENYLDDPEWTPTHTEELDSDEDEEW